jgi:hypothetical protein
MNPQKTIIVILAALSASLTLADDFKTMDGKEYKDARVTHVEPDGIVVKTKTGISKLYFAELPQEVQRRFNYDPRQAAVYSAAQAAATMQTDPGQAQAEGTPIPNQPGLNVQEPGTNTGSAVPRQRLHPRPTPRYTTVIHPLPAMGTPVPNTHTAPNTPPPAKAPVSSNKPVHQPPPPAPHPKPPNKKKHN